MDVWFDRNTTTDRGTNVISFKTQCAQGDVLFRRVEKVPAGAKSMPRNGAVVVAHSETGHHHAFPTGSSVELFTTTDPLVCYLRCEQSSVLEHLRPFDTHESISFSPGCYEVRRQREWTPEGWRRVED